jgi:hypothetical protein
MITDHKPNTGNFKAMTRMQTKWVSLLETFQNQGMSLVYQPGRTNVADPLSRHPSFVSAMTTRRVKRIQHASPPAPRGPSCPYEGEGSTTSTGQLLGTEQPSSHCFEPATSRPEQLQERLRARPLPGGKHPPTKDKDSSPEIPVSAGEQEVQLPPPPPVFPDLEKQILEGYEKDPWFADPRNTSKLEKRGNFWFSREALVIPNQKELKDSILYEFHDVPSAGHVGFEKTSKAVVRHFWWPRFYQDVRDYIKTCESCQRNKSSNQSQQGCYNLSSTQIING